MSEWLLEFMEPIAKKIMGGEVSYTEEDLMAIDRVNNDMDTELDISHIEAFENIKHNNNK